jgi:hypothetical protein
MAADMAVFLPDLEALRAGSRMASDLACPGLVAGNLKAY